MKRIHSEAVTEDPLREDALQQVRENPLRYRDLAPEYKSDPEICLATLSAFDDNNDDVFPSVLEMVDQCAPHFANHKTLILHYLEMHDDSLAIYLECFGRRICQDPDLIKELAQHEDFETFYGNLPLGMHSDHALLKLAVESVPDATFHMFLRAIPEAVVVANEFILCHVLARPKIQLEYSWVPFSFWSNREFVINWSEKGGRVSIHSIPPEFMFDREICRSLYKNKFGGTYMEGFQLQWISTSLRQDKPFILNCLKWHPQIFEYCGKELQRDFDVLVEAAYGEIRMSSFGIFIEKSDESSALLGQLVHSHIITQAEFMTFLGCAWKSRLTSIPPLSVLDCDEETFRGLTTVVAQYLGFSLGDPMERLNRIWEEIVMVMVARRTLAKTLLPLVRPYELVHGVLKAIAKKMPVTLSSFPDELWTHRSFVLWAAAEGKFHESIPREFSEDCEICHAYYKHSPAAREKVWPWMSESVKSNTAFILNCAKIDPLWILGHRHKDVIGCGFEILLSAVYYAAKRGQLDALVEAARVGGWAGSLVSFSQSVRVKMEVQYALKCFKADVKKRYFANVPVQSISMLSNKIGSYLDPIVTEGKEFERRLHAIWSYHSIFYLALGGNIDDLCRANKFRPEKKLPKSECGDSDLDIEWIHEVSIQVLRNIFKGTY